MSPFEEMIPVFADPVRASTCDPVLVNWVRSCHGRWSNEARSYEAVNSLVSMDELSAKPGPREVARFLSVSLSELKRWRDSGEGPMMLQFDGRIYYWRADVIKFSVDRQAMGNQ